MCLILLDGVVQSIFEVGDTWVMRNAPLVDNVEGARTPHDIVELLGVPLAFLGPFDPDE